MKGPKVKHEKVTKGKVSEGVKVKHGKVMKGEGERDELNMSMGK